MAQRTGGIRRKSRHKLRKPKKLRGKISIRKFFQKFQSGDKVCLKAEPAIHKGMYHARFHGKVGVIKKQTGKCYEVKIKDGKKEKILILHPVHLKRL